MYLFEGGNAIKTSSPIPAEYSYKLAEKIATEVCDKLGCDYAILGSVGKKPEGQTNGDIDIAIEYSWDKLDNLIDVIQELYGDVESFLSKGFHQYSIGFKYTYKGKLLVAQVDFMFSNNLKFTKFVYHSPNYKNGESEYKGLYRTEFLDVLCSMHPIDKEKYPDEYFTEEDFDGKYTGELKSFWKYTFTKDTGITIKHKSFVGKTKALKTPTTIKEDTIFVMNDPEEVLHFIMGPDATFDDVNSFETIVEYLFKHKTKPELVDIFDHVYKKAQFIQDEEVLKKLQKYVDNKFEELNESLHTRFNQNNLNEAIFDIDDYDDVEYSEEYNEQDIISQGITLEEEFEKVLNNIWTHIFGEIETPKKIRNALKSKRYNGYTFSALIEDLGYTDIAENFILCNLIRFFLECELTHNKKNGKYEIIIDCNNLISYLNPPSLHKNYVFDFDWSVVLNVLLHSQFDFTELIEKYARTFLYNLTLAGDCLNDIKNTIIDIANIHKLCNTDDSISKFMYLNIVGTDVTAEHSYIKLSGDDINFIFKYISPVALYINLCADLTDNNVYIDDKIIYQNIKEIGQLGKFITNRVFKIFIKNPNNITTNIIPYGVNTYNKLHWMPEGDYGEYGKECFLMNMRNWRRNNLEFIFNTKSGQSLTIIFNCEDNQKFLEKYYQDVEAFKDSYIFKKSMEKYLPKMPINEAIFDIDNDFVDLDSSNNGENICFNIKEATSQELLNDIKAELFSIYYEFNNMWKIKKESQNPEKYRFNTFDEYVQMYLEPEDIEDEDYFAYEAILSLHVENDELKFNDNIKERETYVESEDRYVDIVQTIKLLNAIFGEFDDRILNSHMFDFTKFGSMFFKRYFVNVTPVLGFIGADTTDENVEKFANLYNKCLLTTSETLGETYNKFSFRVSAKDKITTGIINGMLNCSIDSKLNNKLLIMLNGSGLENINIPPRNALQKFRIEIENCVKYEKSPLGYIDFIWEQVNNNNIDFSIEKNNFGKSYVLKKPVNGITAFNIHNNFMALSVSYYADTNITQSTEKLEKPINHIMFVHSGPNNEFLYENCMRECFEKIDVALMEN